MIRHRGLRRGVKRATDHQRGIRWARQEPVEHGARLRELAEDFEVLALHILHFDAGEIDVQLGALANAVPFFGQVQQLLSKFQCLVGEGAFCFEEQDAVEGLLDLLHELPLRVLDVPCGTVQASDRNLLALPPFPAERNVLRQLHGVLAGILEGTIPSRPVRPSPSRRGLCGKVRAWRSSPSATAIVCCCACRAVLFCKASRTASSIVTRPARA